MLKTSYCVNWSFPSLMSSKLEPVIWSHWHWPGHIGIHGGADVRTDVHDVMAIKPNFLALMGYHIFLTMELRKGERYNKQLQ